VTRKDLWLPILALFFSAACGEADDAPPSEGPIVTQEMLTPREAVAQVRLDEAWKDLWSYQYCDKTFPEACDEYHGQVYVLSREADDDYRLVYFNNQDVYSAPASFDYLTVDPYGEHITAVGRFEWAYKPHLGDYEEEGEPLWGIPK
jgi:hypothetical protein